MIEEQVNHRTYKRALRGKTEKHSDATRMVALSVYAETLNVAEAARVSGLPYTTIAGWLEQDETDSQLEVLRNALRSHLAFKCAQASSLAVDAVIDRLQNGDCKLDKDGNEIRVKVSAKDAGYLAASMIDRHALLTGTSANHGKANAALTMVADKLMQAIKSASLQGGANPGAVNEQPDQA